MILKIAYDDDSTPLVTKLKEMIPDKFPLLKLESYHEELFTERKKAFKLKGGFSARHNPFAVLIDNDSNPVRAFYSESGDCTKEEIIKTLTNFAAYEQRS